jgi:hypothetical protein
MKVRALALVAVSSLGGCLAFPSPVVLDVTCPTGAELRPHFNSGACELPGGIKHGPAYMLAPDTQRLLVFATYDHDTLDGRYVRYRSDGKEVEEGTYYGGKKNGIWTTYDADGSRTEQAYVDDYAKGAHQRFDESGKLRLDGYFEGPDPDGTFTEYDASGKTVRVTKYAKGVVVAQQMFAEATPRAPVPVPPPKIEAPPTISNAAVVSNVDDQAAETATQAEATARVVSPAKTRLFPFDGDVAFEASVLLGQDGSTVRSSSGFVGGALNLGAAFGTLRYKTNHYSGTYVAVGASGAYGEVSRAECEVGSGFCGTRYLLGPYARLGYARSHDPSDDGAIASFKAYLGVAALFGEDQWRVVGVEDSAFVWRARLSAGYTGLSVFKHFFEGKNGHGQGAEFAVPFLFVIEHGDLFFDLGMDRAGGVVSGFGMHLGFGL